MSESLTQLELGAIQRQNCGDASQGNEKGRDGAQWGESRCAGCMDGAYREQRDLLGGGHRREMNVSTALTFPAQTGSTTLSSSGFLS